MNKRLILSFFVAAALVAGCGSDQQEETSTPQQQRSQMQQQKKGQAPQLKQQKSIDPSSITDEELRQFAKAMQEAQKVRADARSDMQSIVEDEGMSLKRYQQIQMKKRSKKMKDSVNLTDAEQAQIDSIRPQMKEAQKSAQKEMMKAMQSTEMSMKRVQQISRALRQNKNLMKRFKKIQAEMMSQDTAQGSQ